MRVGDQITCWCVLLGVLATCGCRPEVSTVAKHVEKYQIGIHRSQILDSLINDYKELYKKYPAGFITKADPPLQTLSEEDINLYKRILSICKTEKLFYQVHPQNLLESLFVNNFSDSFGIVAEAATGNGSVIFYYDSSTNYIGFFAYSFLEKMKQ